MENNEAINFIKQAFDLKEQKYYKPAIEMLYKALEIENDNVEILYQIGELYFLLNNMQRAVQYLDKVRSIFPNHENTYRLTYDICMRSGEYDNALTVAQNLYENYKNKDSLSRLIKVLVKLKLFSEIEKYKDSEFFDNDVKTECAEALYLNGEVQRASELISKCDENDERVLLLKGKMKYDEGDYEASKEIFNRISVNTQNPEILNYLGLFELDNMNFIEAIKHFSQASNIDKNNSKYFYNLANAYFYNGWIKEAKQAYSKAIYLSVDNADYRYSLAYLYYDTGDYAKAKKEIDAVLDLNPEHYSGLVLKGLLYAKDKKYVEAVEVLDDCIAKNPDDDYAKKSLSLIYSQLGNYEKAKQLLESTEAYRQKSVDVLCDLAEIYILKKDCDKAIDVVNDILGSNLNYISAYILGAKASFIKEDYEKTKEFAQQALSLDINCAAGYYYLALSRQRTDDLEEAIECMKRAILYDLNNSKYYAKMSEFYKEKEDYRSALEYISEAEKLEPVNEYKSRYSELAKLCRKKL